mgnify:CR=1 FL=1
MPVVNVGAFVGAHVGECAHIHLITVVLALDVVVVAFVAEHYVAIVIIDKRKGARLQDSDI